MYSQGGSDLHRWNQTGPMFGTSSDRTQRSNVHTQQRHMQRAQNDGSHGQSGWEARLAPLYAAAESVGAGPLFEQILQENEIVYGSNSYNPQLAGNAVSNSTALASAYYAQFPGLAQESIATPDGPLTYTVVGSRPQPQSQDDLTPAELASVLGYSHAETSSRMHNGMQSQGHSEHRDMPAGMIFGCKESTKGECLRRQIFGLPRMNADLVTKIKPGAKLFLFNFDTRELYGIFEAVSSGGMDLDRMAFGGSFPAQVRFAWSVDCPPLPEDKFSPAIKDNYYKKGKFKFELNPQQVSKLKHLFHEALKAATGRSSQPLPSVPNPPVSDSRNPRDKRDSGRTEKRDRHRDKSRDGGRGHHHDLPRSSGGGVTEKSLTNAAPRVPVRERISRPPVHERLGPRLDKFSDAMPNPFDRRGRKGPFGEYLPPDLGARGRGRPFPMGAAGLLGPGLQGPGPLPRVHARGGYGSVPPSGLLLGLRPGKPLAPPHRQRGVQIRDGGRLASAVAVVGRGSGSSGAGLLRKKPVSGSGPRPSQGAKGDRGSEGSRGKEREKAGRDKGKQRAPASSSQKGKDVATNKQKGGAPAVDVKKKAGASGSSAPVEVRDEKKEEKKKKEGRSVVTGWPAAPIARKPSGSVGSGSVRPSGLVASGSVQLPAGEGRGSVGTKRKDVESSRGVEAGVPGAVAGGEGKSVVESVTKKAKVVEVKEAGTESVSAEDKAVEVVEEKMNVDDAPGTADGVSVSLPKDTVEVGVEGQGGAEGKAVAESVAVVEPGDGEDEDVDIDGDDDAEHAGIEYVPIEELERSEGGDAVEMHEQGAEAEATEVVGNVEAPTPMEEDSKESAVKVSAVSEGPVVLMSVVVGKAGSSAAEDEKTVPLEGVENGEKDMVAAKERDGGGEGEGQEVEVGDMAGQVSGQGGVNSSEVGPSESVVASREEGKAAVEGDVGVSVVVVGKVLEGNIGIAAPLGIVSAIAAPLLEEAVSAVDAANGSANFQQPARLGDVAEGGAQDLSGAIGKGEAGQETAEGTNKVACAPVEGDADLKGKGDALPVETAGTVMSAGDGSLHLNTDDSKPDVATTAQASSAAGKDTDDS